MANGKAASKKKASGQALITMLLQLLKCFHRHLQAFG